MRSLFPSIQLYVDDSITAASTIPDDRRSMLSDFASHILGSLNEHGQAKLNFICTHNSRRSHLSHVWAQVAAYCKGLNSIQTFSGGTEATECNQRTIAALNRAGFQIVQSTTPPNPRYNVQYASSAAAIEVFSKVYSDTSTGNPAKDYIAGMCCDDVDQKCPVVLGAIARIPLHYRDPKVADGTPEEGAKYDERCRQIATEMFFLMDTVKRQL